jgi:uncharacterized protein
MGTPSQTLLSDIDDTDTCGRGRPFIHRFSTEKHKYIFDVNTGEILRVDDVVWTIIRDSHLDEDQVISKHASEYGREQIEQALEEIRRKQSEEGMCLSEYPQVGVQLDAETVHKKLTHHRGHLILNVTDQCNLRCSYCPYTLADTGIIRDHGTRHMSWEVARAAIDDFLTHSKAFRPGSEPPEGHEHGQEHMHLFDGRIADGSVRDVRREEMEQVDVATLKYRIHIAFYGGEPLLNFPLVKKCTEYALERLGKRAGLASFGMTTNGYLLKGEIAEFLGAHRFILRVSMDGPADVHDRHRRTAGNLPTWDVVKTNVQAYMRRYPQRMPSLAATVSYDEDIDRCVKYLGAAEWIPPYTRRSCAPAGDPWPGYRKEKSGDDFGLSALYRQFVENLIRGRIGHGQWNRELCLQRRIFEKRFEVIHRARWNYAQVRRHSRVINPSGMCLPGMVRQCVSVDGAYYPCERVVGGEELQIGNVSAGMDYNKVLDMMKEFVECTREECEQCWCLPICGVECWAATAGPDGYSKAAKEEACKKTRLGLHRSLTDYCRVLERNPHAFDYLHQYEDFREFERKLWEE